MHQAWKTSGVMATTCDEASYFRAGIALYDAAPWEGGRLLAVH